VQILSSEESRGEFLYKEEKKKEDMISDIIPDMIPWLPEPLRRDKRLRLKYGVMVKADERDMNEERYRIAFIRKLQGLIEKETYPDLAIILDDAFQSPHLVAGNSAEITSNILRDIDEIRRPLELMLNWLRDKTETTLNKLLTPLSLHELSGTPASDKELIKELNSLTLKEFLKLL
jgi:hypothetical protein